MINLTDDQKQTLKSVIILLTESFKVLMATLLSIFVPQRCDNQSDKICTITDNFTNLTDYNIAVTTFNFITLGTFIALYVIEYMRENWCIEYLDIDNNVANTHLKVEIERYPEYKEQMIILNNNYHIISIITVVMNSVNFILSAVLIYGYYYLDYRSVTVLLTNIILIVDKIINCFNVSKKSVEEVIPISAYMMTPVIFNVVDKDYRKSEINIELIESKLENYDENKAKVN
jgi:hypothetical protein